MRISAVAFLMILTTVFLSACEKNDSAQVDDRSQSFYGRGGAVALNGGGMNSNATLQAVPTMGVSSGNLAAPTAGSYGQSAVTNQFGVKSPFATAARWQWPVQGQVTEKFGQQSDGVANEGIVIAASEGTPIRAAASGEVAFVGEDSKNYGNIVILRHTGGEMTSYAHAREIIVKKGERVPAGQILGYVGQSGNAKMPELHFAVREGNHSIDPLSKLPAASQQMAAN